MAPYKGKGTGETTLLRRMYDTFKPGDVILGVSSWKVGRIFVHGR
jgi:hypothetical protein